MKSVFKLLTFTLIISISSCNIFADIISQSSLKTHLRWKINVNKEQINISKKANKVILKSLDNNFYEKFIGEIAKINKNTNYHLKYKFRRSQTPGDANSFEIELKDESIELFTFYKEENSQYILDFWINQDVIATKNAAIVNNPKMIKVAKLNTPKAKKKRKSKKKTKNNIENALRKTDKKSFNIIDPRNISIDQSQEKYRDFRYGAAFIWDYKPFIPSLERDIDLKVKGPDFLYNIKDREMLSDKREAHMQLSINFFRKSQWGLMTRSIKLFEEKYGREKYSDLNDFMRATSMIKNTIKEKLAPNFASKTNVDGDIVPASEFSKKGVMAAARNLLVNAVSSTKDYELSKSILRYQIQYSRDVEDYLGALELAKNLYVKASKDMDDEMIIYSSRVILKSLAQLKQLDKIEEFLKNKAVMRVLPAQEGLAYRTYVNLVNDNTQQVIAEYEANKSSMVKPIHPAIMFNTAEALFREGKYKYSAKLFDEFIANYSFMSDSGKARLRLALAYDLNGEQQEKVLKLYKSAINKTSILGIRYEAKLRYVGLRACRKKNLSKEDKEIIVFLEANQPEKKALTSNHRKLLWSVRLRTMINTGKYKEALSYLSTIPLESIPMLQKRTFEADGAEVILGMIKKSYLEQDYGQAVKIWELYKDKYESKVAKNPYMNFIVADSFLKLGLIKSHERSLEYLKNIKSKRVRAFPRWVNPHKNISVKNYLVELKIEKFLKDQNYKGLRSFLTTQKNNKNINYKFYNGVVSYQLKNYNSAVASFESILVSQNSKNLLTPDQSLTMVENYLESLYEVGPSKRFRKNNAAIVNDLRRNRSKRVKPMIERASYLYLESLFSEKNVDHNLMVTKTDEFLKEYKESGYKARINYLKGISHIQLNQNEEGKKLLSELIESNEAPEYLKGLARTELSSLVLKEKTL